MPQQRIPARTDPAAGMQAIPLVRLLSMAVTVALAELHGDLNANGHPALRPVHGYALNAVLSGQTTASAIAPLLAMTKQGAARVVAHLVNEGYLQYTDGAGAHDARNKPLQLTDRGTQAVKLALRAQDRIEARWREVAGDRQVAGLRRTLETVVRHDRDTLPAVRLGW